MTRVIASRLTFRRFPDTQKPLIISLWAWNYIFVESIKRGRNGTGSCFSVYRGRYNCGCGVCRPYDVTAQSPACRRGKSVAEPGVGSSRGNSHD